MTTVPDAGSASDQYCHFFDDSAFEETTRPGFRRRVITGESLQLCFWRIDGGATGSYMHQHDAHEQLGIVMRGELDFRIGEVDDETRTVLRPGEVYLAPHKVWHGDSVFVGDDELDECWILDVFSPPRDDLRDAQADPTVTRPADTIQPSDQHAQGADR
ncbi:cupin domain-containing protein [Ilumatobacter nonamiensis]|uniref:cupin domain-containing protein n=1 Tax=Ilumatobacter nonamiensis TaxID=467093 RepID=UPI00034DA51D|nr:cupin domain-containing protein [Ilumatobacter nonamiensis]